MNLHKELTEDEIKVFKQWARDNWRPGEPINLIWHPVIVEECKLMHYQKGKQNEDNQDTRL